MWPICMCMYVLSVFTCFFRSANSLPVYDKETGRRLTGYDILPYSGRTLKAIDWETCEFGDTLQTYDENCPNGATGLLPCNPGQLKVAECIGQDGDTSRVCDPCPQKFFQSSYNRCTACHECSECSPDERIKEPCTDETDTVCESIIAPPPPDPITTPTAVTDAPVPSPSAHIPDENTPVVQDPTTPVSSDSATKNVPLTEGPFTIQTTQNVSARGPAVCASINKGPSTVILVIGISAATLWIVVVIILVIVLWNTCRRLKEEQRKNRELEGKLSTPSVAVTSASRPNGIHGPERLVSDREGSPKAQRSNQVVDCPDDERPLLSRGWYSLKALLPSNVVKDSHRSKGVRKRKEKSRNKSGDSRRDQSGRGTSATVTFSSLTTGDRTNLQQSRDTGKVESLQGEDTHQESNLIPPVIRKADDDLHPCNEKVPPSIITTADVHNPEDLPRERGRGDGGSLVMSDVVQDGYCSRDVPSSRHGQDDNPSNQSPNDDLNWLAEKVPGSTAFPQTSTNSRASCIEMLPLGSEEYWHAEKVPGSFALPPTSTNSNVSSADVPSTDMPHSDSDVYWHAEKVPGSSILQEKSIRDPNTVTDVLSDNTRVEVQENNPRTLHSSVGRPEAPIAGEEDWTEGDPEATGANNNEFDNYAPAADTDTNVLQKLTEPEATAFNNSEANTTPPGGQMPEDDNGQRIPRKRKTFPFFKRQRRKASDNLKDQPTQQPLLTKMDEMVEEECLEYVADKLKLNKLDKLCRELGLKETEVANHKYDLKSQHFQGTELAFKMLVRIRDSQGVKFSYRRLDKALRASNNARLADGMVSEFQLKQK